MPDWRVAEDYAFTASLSLEQWAWEFLRRNPQYQRDYQLSVEPEQAWQDSGGGRLNENAIYTPPREPDETPRAWRLRVALDDEHALAPPLRPAIYYAQPWPIRGPIQDPANDEPPKFRRAREYPRLMEYRDTATIFTVPEEEPDAIHQDGAIAAISLNLGMPIEAQLERIRDIYTSEKDNREIELKQGMRPTAERWTDFLRILDAKIANIVAVDICQVLYPDYHSQHTRQETEKEISRKYQQCKFLFSTEGVYKVLNSKLSTG